MILGLVVIVISHHVIIINSEDMALTLRPSDRQAEDGQRRSLIERWIEDIVTTAVLNK